ncbi:hypothetical protein HAX54_003074 [Datura stramonium]|uniref:Uncharacterized protein n=1 Tax=Datura stramonium TaxID=4076 RepID=A0ABS8RT70_DATST|nr:hypothetical protein [Datura stramonium]
MAGKVSLDDQDPHEDAKNLVLGGTQMTARLHRLDEGEKFRKYKAGSLLDPILQFLDPNKPKMLISKAIEIEHAEKARDKDQSVTDLGLDGTMDDLAVVKIVEGGIGLVHPDQADEFYDSMHSYLSEVGITGVKVDVIHTLEYVSEEYGGRVELAKKYYNGLSKSLAKNFNGTGLISSMQQCNDFFLLGTKQISMGRVGDDFWFQDPNGDPNGVYWLQGVHMIHCAYYQDCIFKNPLFDGKTILKIWNFNKYGGVIGAFNCQGAGWDPKEKRIRGYSNCYKPMTGSVHVHDIEWDQLKEASEMGKTEEYAVYLNQAEKLFLTKAASDTIPMSLEPSNFEIFSFCHYASKVEVKGCGNFLAYSSVRLSKCFDGAEVEFKWSSQDGKLTINVPWIEEGNGISNELELPPPLSNYTDVEYHLLFDMANRARGAEAIAS